MNLETEVLLETVALDAINALASIACDKDEKAADRVKACDILITRAAGNFDVAAQSQVVFCGEDKI